jgi:hypothetical protein
MLYGQDITQLRIVCEDYNIPLPDYVIAAQDLKAATAALYVKVQSETPPTTNGVTTKTLEATFKALLSWPGHAAREAVATQLTQVADTAEVDAWTRFSQTLMEQLRAPFDEAAAAFTGSDGPALVTLTELGRARDTLTHASKPPDLWTTQLEESTRVLYPTNAEVAMYGVRHATQGMDRFGAEWFKAARLVQGVTLRWMTPLDQVAMNVTLPHAKPKPAMV